MNPQPLAWLFAPSHAPGGAEQGMVPCHCDKSRCHAQPPKVASQERLSCLSGMAHGLQVPYKPIDSYR